LGCTVRELLQNIGSSELTEWAAFMELQNMQNDEQSPQAQIARLKGLG
jgi:hypothetical protein